MATAPILGEIRRALTKIGAATIDSRAADILGSLSYSRRVLRSARKNEKKIPLGCPFFVFFFVFLDLRR